MKEVVLHLITVGERSCLGQYLSGYPKLDDRTKEMG